MKYILIIIVLGLVSCKGEQWAIKKTAKIEYKVPSFLPNYCLTRFPIQTFDSVRTEWIAGDPIVTFDTLIRVDTFMKYLDRTVTRTIRIHDTIRVTANKTKESTVKLEAQKIEISRIQKEKDSLKSDNDKLEVKNSWLFWICIGLGGYLFLKIILRLLFPAISPIIKMFP